jgi:hypothetical protein
MSGESALLCLPCIEHVHINKQQAISILTSVHRSNRANSYLMSIRKMSPFTRLIRFIPQAGKRPLIGQPSDPNLDVGLASYESKPIEVNVYSGDSILNAGEPTGEKATVERLLSPLQAGEVGTIRCIGLNVSRRSVT